MKLGYVCQYYTQKYRGPVTNLMLELSKHIKVVNYSSIERHLQYFSSGIHTERIQKINDNLVIRRYDSWFRISGLVFPRTLTGLLSEDKPDIIQSEEYYQPASSASLKYAKKTNTPFILNHRGSEPRVRTLRERVFFRAANPFCRGIVLGSDAIICLSRVGKAVLCHIYPEAEDKVHVIPNSIDPEIHSGADGKSFRREHHIPESTPLLLCVARLHPQKRIDLLVRAFADVKEIYPETVLCVVGPWFNKEKNKIDLLVKDLRLDDVVLTGPIPNEKVKDAYSAADIVALTSEYEPFGYCLLEAMSQSKPVVAFDVGAVSEIIEDMVTGYIVPFGDINALAERINGLIGDKFFSSKMGSKGFLRVKKNFLLKDNTKRLINLFEGLTG